MTNRSRVSSLLSPASLVLGTAATLVACGGGATGGTGTVLFGATGEEAAVEGYPTSTGIAFADGWSLDIQHVFVSLDQLHLRAGGVETPVEDEPIIVDLHDGDQDLFTFAGIPARRYDDVGYRLLPPVASARRMGTVSEADAAEMVAGRYAIWIVGTATHPTHDSVELDVGVPMDVDQLDCVNITDGTDGIVVPVNGTADAVMTFHLDHFFFDSIIADEPDVRFEAYAAAAGADGTVTYADLATQEVADLHGVDGEPLVDEEGAVLVYDPGSTPLPNGTLQDFVYHQATTVGHFNGEGHCEYEITPVD